MRVLEEITFSLWCTRLLARLVCRCGQNVTLINKWVSYMPGKGGKLKITVFKLLLLLVLVQVMYLTNRNTDKHETWYRDKAQWRDEHCQG